MGDVPALVDRVAEYRSWTVAELRAEVARRGRLRGAQEQPRSRATKPQLMYALWRDDNHERYEATYEKREGVPWSSSM